MIGFRQDPLLHQQSKKEKKNKLMLPGYVADKSGVADASASTGGIDEIGEDETDDTDNSIEHSQHTRDQELRQINQKSTRIKFHNASLLFDIIMALVPILVLFKLSTHPMISRVGQHPRKSSEEIVQMMYRLTLKKRQQEYFFLGAMNEDKCYDFPTIEIPVKKKKRRQARRRELKGNNKQSRQTNNKAKIGKMNRPLARGSPSSPSPTPQFSAGRVSKGAADLPGGKKGGKGKLKKRKKFGQRNFPK